MVFSDALFEDPVETLPEVAVAVGVGVREQDFTHLDSPVVVHLAQVFGGLPDLGVGVGFLLLRALGIGFELREVLQELVGIDVWFELQRVEPGRMNTPSPSRSRGRTTNQRDRGDSGPSR